MKIKIHKRDIVNNDQITAQTKIKMEYINHTLHKHPNLEVHDSRGSRIVMSLKIAISDENLVEKEESSA